MTNFESDKLTECKQKTLQDQRLAGQGAIKANALKLLRILSLALLYRLEYSKA